MPRRAVPVSGPAPRTTVPATVLVLGLLAALLAGCGRSGEEDAATRFLSAWARGDVAAAAAATDDPAAATAYLTAVDRALGLATTANGTLEAGSAGSDGTVAYTATWPLPGVVDPWRYDGRVAVATGPDGASRVHWEPQDVHPRLAPDRTLALTRGLPPRAPLLDAAGAPLTTPTETVAVGLVPGQAGDVPAVAGALAGALGIDAAPIVADAARARPDQLVPVITLRRPDYDAVRARIYDLPGVVFRSGVDQLGPSAHWAQPLLGQVGEPTAEQLRAAGPGVTATDRIGTSGLQRVVDGELTGAASAAVDVVTGTLPVERLATFPGHPGTPVATTLERRVQDAAETALTGVPRTAAIVAVRPSTGAVVAVANSVGAPFDVALAGRYPPGSTFKIVTAAAALGAGLVRPDTPVDCPGSIVVDGRTIPNENGFALGVVPFSQAFAQSCNTTFARLAQQLPPGALASAAASFGIGAGWGLPVESFDGSFASAPDAAGAAANAFGQGTDLVSPLAEALMAATVVRGAVPTPVLLPSRPTTVGRTPPGLPAGVVAALGPMMRDVVVRGTAPELAAVGGAPVSGKTGTAEHGDPPQAHSWFTGFRGDLAFTVFVEDGQTAGVPSNPVAARFVTALGG